MPNLIYPPSGCRFHHRCQYRFEACNSKVPKSIEVEPEYFVACHLYDPQYKSEATLKLKELEKKDFSNWTKKCFIINLNENII